MQRHFLEREQRAVVVFGAPPQKLQRDSHHDNTTVSDYTYRLSNDL